MGSIPVYIYTYGGRTACLPISTPFTVSRLLDLPCISDIWRSRSPRLGGACGRDRRMYPLTYRVTFYSLQDTMKIPYINVDLSKVEEEISAPIVFTQVLDFISLEVCNSSEVNKSSEFCFFLEHPSAIMPDYLGNLVWLYRLLNPMLSLQVLVQLFPELDPRGLGVFIACKLERLLRSKMERDVNLQCDWMIQRSHSLAQVN